MAQIRPDDLPPSGAVNPASAIIVDDGVTVSKATPVQVVDSGRPIASQAQAEAGVDNANAMTALRVKQAIDAQTTSLADLAAPSGASLIGFIQSGTGAVATTAEGKMRQVFSVLDFIPVSLWAGILDGTSTTDVTSYFQAANDAAYANGPNAIYIPSGRYVINGTITISSGVTFYGETRASEYFPGFSANTANGTLLHKPSTGTNGPIFVHSTGSAIVNLYLKHEKVGGATTGVIQMGGGATSDTLYNSVVRAVRIYGHAIDSGGVYAAANCNAIWFPESDLGTAKQRYFNRVESCYISNCDIAIRLGGQSNANVLANNITRQCYRHYVFDGGSSEVADNAIIGALMGNIGALPTATTAMVTLIGSVNVMRFSGVSEGNGVAFDSSGLTSGSQLDFSDYVPNEITGSHIPFSTTNQMNGFAAPVVREQGRQVLLPNSTGANRYTFGQGNKVDRYSLVTGTLPQLAGGTTLVAGDPDSKRIVFFNGDVYNKAARSSFKCRLKVFVCATGGGVGEDWVEVEFYYRVTDLATNAASLMVTRTARSRPIASSFIGGLFFLTGVAAASNFGIAMTGSNFAAIPATHVAVDMEITALTETTGTVSMAEYADLTFVSTACTANDVTDAIDLFGSQAVTNPTGGATIDAEARTAINALNAIHNGISTVI